MAENLLQVIDLTAQFAIDEGTVHAVNGISFSVKEGETVGIVGESGCGKTVSMLSLMGLLPSPPAMVSGEIHFRGRDLLRLSPSEWQDLRGTDMAMIFQNPMSSLNPVLSISFQLAEPLRAHLGMGKEEARGRAVELLEMVGIPVAHERLDNYPHQFSGGMRQRVMIAAALACNPSLLIADEPTTALDVTIQAQILELVRRLRDRFGMSLIWITHNLGVVAGIADRVLVMYAGHIVEEAEVMELYEAPLHPYTLGLLRSIPPIDGSHGDKLESIKGSPPDLMALPCWLSIFSTLSILPEYLRTSCAPSLPTHTGPQGGLLGRHQHWTSEGRDVGNASRAGKWHSMTGSYPLIRVDNLKKHFPVRQGLILQRQVYPPSQPHPILPLRRAMNLIAKK